MRPIMEFLLLLSRFAAFYAFGITLHVTNNRMNALFVFFVIFNLGTILHFVFYKKLGLGKEKKWRESGFVCNNIIVFVFPIMFFLIPNFPLMHLFVFDSICMFFLGLTFTVSMVFIVIDRKANP